MSDDAQRPEKKAPSGLDLSGLNEMSLGPNWGTGNLPSSKTPPSRSRDGDSRGSRPDRSSREGGGRPPSRDRRGDAVRRRPDAPPGGEGDRPPRSGERGPPRGERFPRGGERGERGGGERGYGRGAQQRPEPPFRPLLAADFYPDDAPFKALTQAIKTTCRTFELFEIARLILEKPDRWVCVAKHPAQKEGEDALLHACVIDGLPFLSEQAAIEHAIKHYADQFFEIEAVELEAPNGTFPMIHRCGMTGELLAPPNYHRYQTILRDHHASRLAHVPYERFAQRLEAIREPEAVTAWQEKMKQGERFTVKASYVSEGQTPTVCNTREDARLYLLTHHRDKLVRPAYSVRFVGKDLALLPEGDLLRRSIEALHDYQLRFPLDTANNLRGRLRRLNFAVYKRGSKGVSFVCAVKRHLRQPDEVLSENLADLIAFLEAHTNLKASDLPKQYLGLEEAPAAKPAESTAKAEPLKTEAPASEVAPAAVAQDEVPPSEEAKTSEAETPAAEAAVEPTVEAELAPVAEPATPTPTPTPAPTLSGDQEQILALRRDLRYLVTQGYVIEYSDGRLYVPPVREVGGSEEGGEGRRDGNRPAKRAKESRERKGKKPEAKVLTETSVQPITAPSSPEAEEKVEAAAPVAATDGEAMTSPEVPVETPAAEVAPEAVEPVAEEAKPASEPTPEPAPEATPEPEVVPESEPEAKPSAETEETPETAIPASPLSESETETEPENEPKKPDSP